MQTIINFLKQKQIPENGAYLVLDIVITYVSMYHNFPTVRKVAEIYDALKPGRVSTATIYRYLGFLEERGYLIKVNNTYKIKGAKWDYYGETLPRLDT